MKKHFKPFRFKINTEEMLREKELFKSQPESVLKDFRSVKMIMAGTIPLFIIIPFIELLAHCPLILIIIPGVLFSLGMFLVIKIYLKQNLKVSLAPAFSCALGYLIGLFLVPKAFSIITSFWE